MLSSASRLAALQVLNKAWVIMFDDGFGIMLSKFSDDAKREMRQQKRVQEEVRQQHILSQRFYVLLKRVFLAFALIGVGVGLYFGHELGLLMGEMRYSSSAKDDPTLRGIPEENAKRLRKMSEVKAQHDSDYHEVEKMLDGTQQ